MRAAVVRLGEMPLPEFDETAPLKILVTGGSQGASVLSEVVPAGLGALPPSLRHRLQVVQQCRPNEIDTVEVCFLQGEEEPVLTQETDFDTDDMKFKVRHAVRAFPLDFRGLYKNVGA